MINMKYLLICLMVFAHFPEINAQRPSVQHQMPLDAESYDVKGRNSWFWKRKVSYGEYTTSRVRGGWRTHTEFPFFFTFHRIKQRFSYTQFGPNGMQAQYAGAYIHRQTDLPILGSYFQIPIRYEQYLTGHVYVPNTEKAYEFVLNYPDINTRFTPTEGRIFDKDGLNIEIRGLQRMPGMTFNLPANLGFEFLIDGQVIAVVDGMVHGRVHLAKQLSDEHKTLLAAVMNGLLLHTR